METDKQQQALACAKYEVLFADYLAGECDAAGSAKVKAHLRGCLNCRTAVEESRAGAAFLNISTPLLEKGPQPRPEFPRVTMARIRVEAEGAAERTGFWQPFVSFAWRFAATAVVALVILLTYAVRGGRTQRQRAMVQAPLADVFAPDPTRVPANQDEILLMVAETDHSNGND
ncbi:MAG TPA: zf-HC2 domain-containing protein [Candidatus Acidoferrales bacterium]|jgi:anti-sigma-K factor RskA|nr:zf-HC2 domain-containing protein [Candidatus Acidoferrales bacterium]